MKSAVINKRNIWSGIIGGLVAGVVFGFILIRLHLLTIAGRLMGLYDPLSGFVVHLVFSAILGLIFALVFSKVCTNFYYSSLWGIVYGIIWWFLGPLTLYPLMVGAPVSWNSETMSMAFPLLIGHLVFGLVLGISYFSIRSHK